MSLLKEILKSEAAKEAGKKIAKKIGEEALKEAGDYLSKDHGSKVKAGYYKDCSVILDGDKACIVTEPVSGMGIFLTEAYIQSWKFIKKKKINPLMQDYFYFQIVFKDGTESTVRMREKYVEAMKRYASACEVK